MNRPLGGPAGVAMRIALQDGQRAGEQLEDYLEELDDEDLDDLQIAATRLADAISYVIGRRTS